MRNHREEPLSVSKRESAALLPTASLRKSHSEELSSINPRISGNVLLKNAEALLDLLTYIEQEAGICNFKELTLFVRTARLAAIDLVQDLRGASRETAR